MSATTIHSEAAAARRILGSIQHDSQHHRINLAIIIYQDRVLGGPDLHDGAVLHVLRRLVHAVKGGVLQEIGIDAIFEAHIEEYAINMRPGDAAKAGQVYLSF